MTRHYLLLLVVLGWVVLGCGEASPSSLGDPDAGLTEPEDAALPDANAPIVFDECDVGDAAFPCSKAVAYGNAPEHLYDIYLPELPENAASTTPLVIWVHGGGYVQGSREDVLSTNRFSPFRPQDFLEMGIAVASVDYRLSGDNPFSIASGLDLPPAMIDVGHALQKLRFEAGAYNIDPASVVLAGSSAGGGISSWLAFHDDLAVESDIGPGR